MQSTRRDELRNEMRYRRVIEIKPVSTVRRSFRRAGSIFLTLGIMIVTVALVHMVTR